MSFSAACLALRASLSVRKRPKSFHSCTLVENISRKGPRKCRFLHGAPHGEPGQAGQVGFPGIPVESSGFGQVHMVLFRENHISGAAESCRVGNPSSLLMDKEELGVSSGNWFEGSQVSKARPGAPFDFTLRYCRGHKLCPSFRVSVFPLAATWVRPRAPPRAPTLRSCWLRHGPAAGGSQRGYARGTSAGPFLPA
jgi:hypothetical protein